MSLSLLRFSGAAAATLAALCAAGAYPTWRFAGEDGLGSMALAAGISFGGALVGFLPSALSTATRYESRVTTAMAGVVLRLFLTLGVVFAVIQLGLAPAKVPFVVWVGLDYAALLVVETLIAVRIGRRAQGDHGPASA